MIRVCCECKIVMGETAEHIPGDLRETHGFCDPCMQEKHPGVWQEIIKNRADGGQVNA